MVFQMQRSSLLDQVLTLLLGGGTHTIVPFMERGTLRLRTGNGNMILQLNNGRIKDNIKELVRAELFKTGY